VPSEEQLETAATVQFAALGGHSPKIGGNEKQRLVNVMSKLGPNDARHYFSPSPPLDGISGGEGGRSSVKFPKRRGLQ
jgi:hypothetical protein